MDTTKLTLDESQSSDTRCNRSSEASLDTTLASGSGHILLKKKNTKRLIMQ